MDHRCRMLAILFGVNKTGYCVNNLVLGEDSVLMGDLFLSMTW